MNTKPFYDKPMLEKHANEVIKIRESVMKTAFEALAEEDKNIATLMRRIKDLTAKAEQVEKERLHLEETLDMIYSSKPKKMIEGLQKKNKDLTSQNARLKEALKNIHREALNVLNTAPASTGVFAQCLHSLSQQLSNQGDGK